MHIYLCVCTYIHTYSYMNNTYIYLYLYVYVHTHMITFVHICVTVQYYSLYRSDPCGCHPHEPTSLPQDFRVPLACHWLAIGYGGHRPLRLLRLSRL